VRFQPLGADEPNVEDSTFKKHWVLAFSPPSKRFAFTFEAVPREDETICMPIKFIEGSYDAYPLGTYYGEWSDLIKVLEAHPQRNTAYSACFNNCQHFVAIYLTFLTAFAKYTYGKSLTIIYSSRYDRVTSVLNVQKPSGTQIWNDSNIGLATLNFLPIPAAGAAAIGAAAAAEATVATTVSAGGIAGFFGMTTTVMAPAAYAGIASVCAPLAFAGTGFAGAAYLFNKRDWKRKTLFDNPLVKGFPRGWFPALTFRERSFPNPTAEAKAKFLSSRSASAASTSTILMASASIPLTPHAVGAVGASALYKLAAMVVSMSDIGVDALS